MLIFFAILLIVIAALAVVAVIWDIRSVKRLESGLKTINKRVKRLEGAGGSGTYYYTAMEDKDDSEMGSEAEKEDDRPPITADDDEV